MDKIKIHEFIVAMFCVLLICGCGEKKLPVSHITLEGDWLLDSIYTYYNGFSYLENDMHEEELVSFRHEGEVTYKSHEHELRMTYQIVGNDSLIFFTDTDGMVGNYKVLSINQGHLAVKRLKNPLFDGEGQVFYEIRYFTRLQEGHEHVGHHDH